MGICVGIWDSGSGIAAIAMLFIVATVMVCLSEYITVTDGHIWYVYCHRKGRNPDHVQRHFSALIRLANARC